MSDNGKSMAEMTDIEWLRYAVEFGCEDGLDSIKDDVPRLGTIADRLELLEKAHSEQTKQMSAVKQQEEQVAALLTEFVTWMVEAHADNPDSVEVEHFQVLATIHLGTQLRAGARTMSMGSAIGGIGGLLGGIGAAALEKMGGIKK